MTDLKKKIYSTLWTFAKSFMFAIIIVFILFGIQIDWGNLKDCLLDTENKYECTYNPLSSEILNPESHELTDVEILDALTRAILETEIEELK